MVRSIAVVLFLAAGSVAQAGDEPKPPHQPPPPHHKKTECFNVVCQYGKHEHGVPQCEAAVRFIKEVGSDGSETWDDSADGGDAPSFEVSCNEELIYNGKARRFTDRQGTRIQGFSGPSPAILLPRGALRDDHQYVTSALKLRGQALDGYCYVYTGPAL